MTPAKQSTPIDPAVLHTIVALVFVGLTIEIVDRLSPVGAWVLAGTILTGIVLKNQLIIGFFQMSAQS